MKRKILICNQFKIAVQRDTADDDDTYDQDIGLIGVEIKYQEDPGTMTY